MRVCVCILVTFFFMKFVPKCKKNGVVGFSWSAMGKFANKGRCQNRIIILAPEITGTYPAWWTYKKQWKMAIEIVDFPIKNGDFPWQNVSSPEGKYVSAIDPNMTCKDCHSKLLKITEFLMNLRPFQKSWLRATAPFEPHQTPPVARHTWWSSLGG